MTPRRFLGAALLASVAAFAVATLPETALAGPKGCKPGHAGAGSCVPPGHAASNHAPPGLTSPCPPGLAKKGSCVPPGLRKHWIVGDVIPRDVVYRRVYYGDYDLPRPRSGQVYANIGGDIYLLAEATRRVIEAINLVDAATR